MSLQKNRFSVWLYTRMLRFAAWLQNLPNAVTPPAFRVLQIGSAYWQSRALYVAARLDIATILGDDRLSVETLAQRSGADAQSLYRLLRMLVAMGIFCEDSGRQFRNTALSACLREDRPNSMRAMVLMHNADAMSRPWYSALEAGVRQGTVPFEQVNGSEFYRYLDEHAELEALFSRAMDSVERLVGESYVTDFDWGRFTRVIDVGGSKGEKSTSILRHYPRLEALVVDRAHVIEVARASRAAQSGDVLARRLQFEVGDIFGTLPASRGAGDVYLLSAVLHGFDDTQCVQALQRLAAVMGKTGATLAILEMVMAEHQADYLSASFDMQMFVQTRGRERTLVQWLALFERSGLVLREVVGLRNPGKMLVVQVAG